MKVTCKRCGRECRPGVGNPEARLLKRSTSGYCVDCALTMWLKNTEPVNELLKSVGPESLRQPHIRLQIAQILIAGRSDANIGEIDVERVIANWDLPVKERK